MEGAVPVVQKESLVERLAQGVMAGLTVVTPNHRLALTLAREVGDRQVASGRTVWEAPDILPFGAFIERLYADALFSERGATMPALLSEAQEQTLWETILGESKLDLLSPGAAATQCREAWKLLHAWELREPIESAPLHDDARAFVAWLQRYEKLTSQRRMHRWRAASRCASPFGRKGLRALARVAGRVRLRSRDTAAEALPRCARGRTRAGRDLGSGIARVASHPVVVRLGARRDGRVRAAGRARGSRRDRRASASSRRISRGCAARSPALSRTSWCPATGSRERPATRCPSRSRWVAPRPAARGPGCVAAHPPVRARAGARARLAHRALAIHRGRRDRARSTRARRRELRRRATAVVTIAGVQRLVEHRPSRCRCCARRLVRLVDFQRKNTLGNRAPSAWARAFTDALETAGFPGERALDSVE
jgi:hypothetical protein